ncbi:MAG: ABC transporter permease [Bacteroidales bacterium]|nr:ABC transporter permease [Bacteroidales bacterium]
MKLMLFDPENWREIGTTLARNKTRTFLTAFGIFWGTAMLAMLWGGAHGFEGIMRRNFAGMATNLGGISASSRTMSYKGFNKGSYWQLNFDDINAIKRVAPAIEDCSEVISRWGNAVYGTRSKGSQVLGVGEGYSRIVEPLIVSGRFINASDIANTRKVVVIGRNRAADLFGNDDAVGKYITLNGVHFRCIGVASQLGEGGIGGNINDMYIIPSPTMRLAFNTGNRISYFVYTAPAGHSPKESQDAIRRVVYGAHTIHPDDKDALNFMDISEMFQMVDNLFLGLSLLALFIGAGSLLAGIIGVGNIMWIVVKERTHEFGIRRAIGATPADITVQVLSESILLTLVAGTAGVTFAAIVLGIADKATEHPVLGLAGFELSFATAITIVVLFFILGTAAGTLPAVKAMRIKPIEAIQDK